MKEGSVMLTSLARLKPKSVGRVIWAAGGSKRKRLTPEFKARLLKVQKFVAKKSKIKIETLSGLRRSGQRVPCVATPWQEMDDWLTGDVTELGAKAGTGRGMPRGRIVEVFGPESTCKTTLALQLIASYQKAGYICAFIDVEHAFDPIYAAKLGVDVEALLFNQPDSAEEALSLAETLVRSKMVAFVVLDSVAALDPEAEQNKKSGKMQPGLQARLMSQACRKLTAITSKTLTTVLFINQIRMKIGNMYGNPETTAGGNALKFYASIRIELRRFKVVKKGLRAIGTIIKARTQKNKVGTPFRELWLHLRFGQGIVEAKPPEKKKREKELAA